MEGRKYNLGKSHLTVVFGDITTSRADVIVSSDDYMLSMGGGVSAAIRRAAGEGLVHDAVKLLPRKLGDVVVTTAGALSSKYVFHAVTIGPNGETKKPVEVIEQTTRACLSLLSALELKSIALPAIGAGVAGFNYNDVAVIMADVVADYLRDLEMECDVEIYLFDRFYRMSAMDFIAFFEEFSARSRQLSFGTGLPGIKVKTKLPVQGVAIWPSIEVIQRRELVDELAALSQERDLLELRLAEVQDALEEAGRRDVSIRLDSIHRRRVELLAEANVRQPLREKASVFVSYAHADKELQVQLMTHLRILEREKLVNVWHDRMITAGSEWKGTIDRNMEKSTVVLLLVSADFINSDYCFDVEMKKALERHSKEEAVVIPIIMRPVVWNNCPFSKLHALPLGAKAVTEWENRDRAYVDVVEGVRLAIEEFSRKISNLSISRTD